MRARPKTLLFSAFLIVASLHSYARTPKGIIVVKVPEGSFAASAGFLPGDTILKGRLGEERWLPLQNPYQWERFISEEAQRGTVTLLGRREGRRARWTLPPFPWGLEVRPALRAEAESLLVKALAQRASGDHLAAAAAFEQASGKIFGRDPSGGEWWLLLNAAGAFQKAGQPSEAFQRFDKARASAHSAGEPLSEAMARRAHAALLMREGDLAAALSAYQSAVGLLDPVSAPLGRARALLDLAWAEKQAGHIEEAAEHLEECQKLSQPLAPRSKLFAELALARSALAWKRGDFPAAETWGQEALSIYRELDPDSADVAVTASHLGLLHFERGEIAAAERAFRSAVDLWEAKRPTEMNPVPPLANLGMVLIDRGEFSESERYLNLALEAQRQRAAKSMPEAAVLNLLGVLRQSQGNLAGAEEFYTRSLDLKRSLAPRDVETAKSQMNLALILEERGRLEDAEALSREALAIIEASAPGSTTEAIAVHNLSHLLHREGLDAEADAFLQRALRIGERIAPDSPDTATTRLLWAYRAWDAGDLGAAESRGREALRVIQASAAGGLREAEALIFLGSLRGERGSVVEGRAHLEHAIALSAKEGETGMSVKARICLSALLRKTVALKEALGHAEVALQTTQSRAPGGRSHIAALHEMSLVLLAMGERERGLALLREAERLLAEQRPRASAQSSAGFSAEHEDLFQDLMGALVDAGQPEEAFAVLERSRARGLLTILATRELDLSTDIPAEVNRELLVSEELYGRAQDALEEDDPGEGGESRDALFGRLSIARSRWVVAREAVRRASPKAADLRDPTPLKLEEARAALEPGTLLLAYAVGKERTLLFAVGPGPRDFSAWSLPSGGKALGREVRRLREGLQGRGQRAGLAQSLSRTLLASAKGALSRCRRVLISPDGPLHLLPFSALNWPGDTAGKGPLAAYRTVTLTPSITVYAELGRAPLASPTAPAQALGNPLYPAADSSEGASSPPKGFRRALSRGVHIGPLPATKREVEAVRILGGESQIWLGAQASEVRARTLPPEMRILHFACHAYADPDEPLESALLLSPPSGEERGDGALTAWEIIESLRAHSDLVVLSACETGVGKSMGGEGLLGLSRAFFHAGARAVLASLWPVQDGATADFMGRFYQELATGIPADEALRRAQLSAGVEIGPETWAAFVLTGHPTSLTEP